MTHLCTKYIGQYKLVILISLAFSIACVKVSTGNYPPFVKAAQLGNIAEAERLLRAGQFVNQTTIGNQTALHLAAAEGQDQMVLWLLAHEADPVAKDLNGKTPADFAHKQGKNHSEELINDQLQKFQQQAAAIQAGDKAALKELLSKDSRNYTLLHVFGQLAATEEALKEIQSGADVNARTTLEMTPLHKSIVGGQIEIVRALLNAGADVNALDIHHNTPLYYAAFYDNKEIINLLLTSGGDKSIRSASANESPLDIAKRLGKKESISALE